MRAARLLLATLLIAAAGTAGLAGTAAAEDAADVRNRVHFSISQSREVDNDRTTVVIGKSAQDVDLARLANQINEAMNWGLEIAKATDGVDVRTRSYRTYPVHDRQGDARGWRASQDLEISSGDSETLSKLVGKLQEKLELRSYNQSVSRELRDATEAKLVSDLLAAYRERAEQIRKGLGVARFELVEIRFVAGNAPPVARFAAESAMVSRADVAPPSFEGGTSRIESTARVTIQLVP